jgi:hypothetical protein
MSKRSDKLWAALRVLPSDYQDFGGGVERWKDSNKNYSDCSGGCRWWVPRHDEEGDHYDYDWGVCTKPNAPRTGLLTWEHQAGFECFEAEDDKIFDALDGAEDS